LYKKKKTIITISFKNNENLNGEIALLFFNPLVHMGRRLW